MSSHLSWSARLNLGFEVVTGGLVELWSHKLRSVLTLTLLMLGVFALVVLTSVLDGVLDKVGTGFEGMAWDGTVVLKPKDPETTEEQKRFAMSPGLRYEDLARVAAPYEGALAFLPRATKSDAGARGRGHRAHLRHRPHAGVRDVHEPAHRQRPRPHRGRPAAAQLGRRRRRHARHPSSSAASTRSDATWWWTASPAASWACRRRVMIFNEELYLDANGLMIPLETYMDRVDPSHKLTQRHGEAAAQERPRRRVRRCSSAGPSRPTTASRTSRSRTWRPNRPAAMPASWTRCAAGASC